jgi:hypothetical protein
MDLKAFYKKLRKIEQEIADEHVVMVSLETPDGGRAGLKTEVARASAARLILEGRARLGDAKESAEHLEEARVARKAADQRALQDRVQVHVISDADARALNKKRES